jgi:Post-segregation antitoxin CcdA
MSPTTFGLMPNDAQFDAKIHQMARKLHPAAPLKKRRTTLTLPADSLAEAHRLARIKKVNLSSVIAEALVDGLRQQTATERSDEILQRYQKAFSGFRDEEMLLLDGIVLERPSRR